MMIFNNNVLLSKVAFAPYNRTRLDRNVSHSLATGRILYTESNIGNIEC